MSLKLFFFTENTILKLFFKVYKIIGSEYYVNIFLNMAAYF